MRSSALTVMLITTLVTAASSAPAAQSKTIPGDAVTITATASPGGTAAVQRTSTATIVAIDNKAPSITFKGETMNWTYSSRVADRAALAKVKVGERVDITWTEALTVSATSPAKKD